MTTFRPYAKHDADADAIYVVLVDVEVARSPALDDFRIIDYSEDGRVVGVEFIGVGGGVELEDVPPSQKVEKKLSATWGSASESSGKVAQALSVQ